MRKVLWAIVVALNPFMVSAQDCADILASKAKADEFVGADTLTSCLVELKEKLGRLEIGLAKVSLPIIEVAPGRTEERNTLPTSQKGQFMLTSACDAGWTLMGYNCWLKSGGGQIQNFGTNSPTSFYCLWADTNDQTTASATPWCMRVIEGKP